MTRTLSMAQLKAHLSEVVGEVQHTGGEIIIEKHGKPVARLVPMVEAEPKGIAALAGILADEPEFHEIMQKVVRERRLQKPRPAQRFK